VPINEADEGNVMQDYRITSIGRYSQIVAVKIVECADDKHAIQKAEGVVQSHSAIELWQERRLIKRFGA
jgi:hypothetical protein